jgi:DtxR family Mn-dependent transcriptional regulator
MAVMDALSESAEMMIKNIHELSLDGKRVRTSDLAQKTDLKPASVTEMIQRLGEIGLVDYQAYHGVFLTKQGQHVADVIEYRFNILQRFLTEILGV